MSEFVVVFVLALFPAIGNFAGALLGEWLPPSKKTLNRALHVAAGITLAVVAIEVVPKALNEVSSWLLALLFIFGGSLYILIGMAVKKLQRYVSTGAWMIYVAIWADLLGDGLLIGSGSAVSLQFALILAVGQVMADVPEGYAVLANFRDKGMSRTKRLFLSATFFLPVLIGAIGAYFTLRNADPIFKVGGLVFVSGLYCLAAVEDMLGEAHETEEDTPASAFCFLIGFALFVIVSGLFKEPG